MAEINDITDGFLWNISRLAEAFDADRGTCRRKLRQAGVEPVKHKNGVPLYDLAAAAEAIFRPVEAMPATLDDMTPVERKLFYQSENARMAAERTAAHLVPADAAEAQRDKLVDAMVKSLDTLPERLADVLDDSAMQVVEQNVQTLKFNLNNGE